MTQPRLICIIGAESTGKTTLTGALAAHFECPWVPEYLRHFCELHQRTPTLEEQPQILEAQQLAVCTAQVKAVQQKAPFVFCDTAPLLTAIYSDFVFCDVSLYARARTMHASYALTLLLAPDIAWVADGLQRDGAQVRGPVTEMIARELRVLTVPVASISGQGEGRFAAALEALKALGATSNRHQV